jgi:DNA-binding SARP family transcriptional activator
MAYRRIARRVGTVRGTVTAATVARTSASPMPADARQHTLGTEVDLWSGWLAEMDCTVHAWLRTGVLVMVGMEPAERAVVTEQLAGRAGFPLACVKLTPAERDVDALVSTLVARLQERAPGFGARTCRRLASAAGRSARWLLLARSLAADFVDHRAPLGFVLQDLDALLGATEAEQFVGYFALWRPPNCFVGAVGQAVPRLPYATLVARRRIVGVVGRRMEERMEESDPGQPPGRQAADPAGALPAVYAQLLGVPRLLLGAGEPADPSRYWRSRKTREMFALMEAHRAGLRAEAVVDYLWPDADAETGRRQLWKHTHRLRALLGDGDAGRGRRMLLNDLGVLRLSPDLVVGSDVESLHRLGEEFLCGLRAPQDWPGVLAAVETRYSQPYLPDVDSPWTIARREEVERLRHDVLLRCAEAALADGQAWLAGSIAAGVFRDDPSSETACATLIRACLARGDRAGARQAFRALERSLREELGEAPSAEVARLLDDTAD